jgi:hypothetical protein
MPVCHAKEVRLEKGGTEWAEDCTFFCREGNDCYQLETSFFVNKRIISAVRTAEFVGDMMLCIILRGLWYNIIKDSF